MVRRFFGWTVFVMILEVAAPGVVRAADSGRYGPRYAEPRHPCRAAEPYYDHGPNWGEEPHTRHPVYGIDPSCNR